MEVIGFICSKCKHSYLITCAAFPKGIPQVILDTNKHDSPIEDQGNEIVFEYDENYLAKYSYPIP